MNKDNKKIIEEFDKLFFTGISGVMTHVGSERQPFETKVLIGKFLLQKLEEKDKFYQDKFEKALPDSSRKILKAGRMIYSFGEATLETLDAQIAWNDCRQIIKSNWNK